MTKLTIPVREKEKKNEVIVLCRFLVVVYRTANNELASFCRLFRFVNGRMELNVMFVGARKYLFIFITL